MIFPDLNETTDRSLDAKPGLWCRICALHIPTIHPHHLPTIVMQLLNVVPITLKNECFWVLPTDLVI